MAIPTVVLDALNSLKIVSLPPQVNAGDRIDLGLSPGLNAFDVLSQPPTLFDIELNNITLDDIGVDLTDISLAPIPQAEQQGLQLILNADNPSALPPGDTDLEVVSKAVEFSPLSPATGTTAHDVHTSDASLHALAHLIPNTTGVPVLSTDVEGLLSRIAGTVRQVEKFTGGIIGNIGGHINGKITGTIKNLTGSIKAPKLLQSPLEPPTVEWYIEDGNGKRLTENTDFLMLSNTDLTKAAASLMFLPAFAELSAGVDLISRRRIFCRVTVKVGNETADRLLGPVDILLPKVQLPTVLVMTEHAVTGVGYPGAILVAVPSQSLLTLDQLTDKLREVQVVLNRLQTLSQLAGFGDTLAQIDQIISLVGSTTSRVPTFVKQDQVMDLWYVMREPGGFLGFGYKSWEDCISSLIMIGPPGRAARFYNAKNFWERLGAFEIVLGSKAVGHIDDFRGSAPACEPTGLGGCTFTQRWNPPPASFNDVLSSYQFLPLQ
ncbi:MAG TPA: hypothetical protein VJ875_10530 [Pyrinomonadaceae bacterium]|nr:hypothetical protein [Pyrinomonadaceae bacterium]